jgi:hypothetical protein
MSPITVLSVASGFFIITCIVVMIVALFVCQKVFLHSFGDGQKSRACGVEENEIIPHHPNNIPLPSDDMKLPTLGLHELVGFRSFDVDGGQLEESDSLVLEETLLNIPSDVAELRGHVPSDSNPKSNSLVANASDNASRLMGTKPTAPDEGSANDFQKNHSDEMEKGRAKAKMKNITENENENKDNPNGHENTPIPKAESTSQKFEQIFKIPPLYKVGLSLIKEVATPAASTSGTTASKENFVYSPLSDVV